MQSARRQVMVDAPIETVWELIGDVSRHPEWWPRVEEVDCDVLEEGCTYRQVTRQPGGTIETTMSIESLDDCRQLRVRCTETGMYAHFMLTPAQEGTFVDGELGIEAPLYFRPLAPAFVRRWISQSLEGLRRAASARRADQQPSDQRGQPAAGEHG